MRGKPFQPGNKFGRGRPAGSRNKVTNALQETLEKHAQGLTMKCVFDALQGKPTAMRLCMERLTPARRQRMLRFKLPALKTSADMVAASEKVVRGVACAQLTIDEGQAFTAMLEGWRRMITIEEVAVRLRALEEKQNEVSRKRRS